MRVVTGSAPIEMSCRDEGAMSTLIECAAAVGECTARRFWERQSTTGINRVAAPTNHRMRKTVVVQMRKNATKIQLLGEFEDVSRHKTPEMRVASSISLCRKNKNI